MTAAQGIAGAAYERCTEHGADGRLAVEGQAVFFARALSARSDCENPFPFAQGPSHAARGVDFRCIGPVLDGFSGHLPGPKTTTQSHCPCFGD